MVNVRQLHDVHITIKENVSFFNKLQFSALFIQIEKMGTRLWLWNRDITLYIGICYVNEKVI